jgi:CshA-type fibril repeat protein
MIIPTVGAPPLPVAAPDTSSGNYDTNQTINPLTNDALSTNSNFPLNPTTVKLCGAGQTPNGNPACDKTTLTVLNEGTYTVNPITGVVTFDPLPSFTGPATPISYQVTDSLNRTVGSTITVTVGTPPAPTATNDTKSGPYDQDQTISPLANDTATSAFPLDQTTVKLCGPDNVTTSDVNESVPPNCVALSVTTVDGVYTVSTNGTVTFNPDADFTGTTNAPVTYQVTDMMSRTVNATITPTVGAPPLPVAVPDAQTSAYDTNQTYTPTSNDTANSNFPITANSVKLCGTGQVPPACNETSVTTADGVYTVNTSTGAVTFNPEPTFSGTTTTPVTYQATDSLNRTISSTITPTVDKPPAPTALPDTTTGGQGLVQTVNLITNPQGTDSPGISGVSQVSLDAASVKLCSDGETSPNCTATSVTVPNVGTYSVSATGVMTFTPVSTFTGTPPALPYTVTDTFGQKAASTYTPTVIARPTALNDTSTGPMNTAQTKSLVVNDSAAWGATPLNIASVKLCDPNPTAEIAPDCTKTSVTVPGVGTYSVDSSGVMTFTPVTGYSGTPTPLSYTVADNFGAKATATYTPTVIAPPAVVADTTSAGWDVTQTMNVVTSTSGANTTNTKTNSQDTAAAGTTIKANSITIDCANATDCTETVVGGVVTEVIMAGQGTYTVDPATNVITFNPVNTFVGTARPVTYTISDALDQVSTTTYTPTVNAATPPTADPETTSGPKGAAQTIDLLPGDAAAAAGITLDPTSVRLCPATTTTPQTTTACTLTTLTVSGVGTYVVVDGVMTFTPDPNYVGTPPPVVYQVTDSVGGKASSTYTPTVIAPPTLIPDTSTGPWDTNQTRDVVSNNVNTGDSAAIGTSLEDGSIRLCAPSDTAPNCTVDAAGEVVIANQGTYRLNPSTNIIIFDPLPTFTGTATPVTYSVTDELGQKSSTTYTPTVTVPPVPTATPDTVELLPGQSKVFSSIFDGTTGDTDPALATKGTGAPDLTNSSVCIIDPATSVCDTDGIVTIPGQGTYTLNPTTGIVTYAALSTATPGAKTPVTYKITDGLGRSVTSTLTPTITPPPVANPDFSTGVQGAIQTLSPVGNDRPGGGASTTLYPDTRAQVPSGIFLCAANEPPPDCAASTVIVNDPVTNDVLGVLTVAATGLVTFTPEPDFIGTTPPIGYQLPDNLGQKAYSTITITVLPPPAPSATLDAGSAQFNNPVTLKPWLNDSAGAVPSGSSLPAPNLVATSIKLCDDNSTFVAMSGTPADCTATKVQTVEGTYEVNATTGEVVFTPVSGFTGTVKYPPTYQIWNDWTGAGGVRSATALLVPTIFPPVAPGAPSRPVATVDVTKTKPGTSVVLNPVSNDKPGSVALDPTTIRLCGAGEISPACTKMSVTTIDGLYVVSPGSGMVTFTPRDGFIGQATIPYIIKDGAGMLANANLIITVEDSAVVKKPKKKTGLANTGSQRPDVLLLLGILAMVGAGGLRILSRKP